MDDGSQTKAVLESGLWDGAVWLIGILATALGGLSLRTWNRHEKRLDEIESMCMSQHTARQHDLTQHSVADAASHDAIRRELSTELRLVYDKIETNNNKSVERFDALSKQMSDQHGVLMEHVIDLHKTIKESGK